MKNIFSFCIIAFLFFNSICAANNFTLRANIDSVKNGIAVLTYEVFSGQQFKEMKYSTKIQQGNFEITGELNEPVEAQLEIDKIRLTIYIEPSKMKLLIPINNPNNYVLKGSKINEDIKLYLLDSKDILDKAIKISEIQEKQNENIKITPETDPTYAKLVNENKLTSIKKDSLSSQLYEKRIKYIISHPHSYQSVVDESIVYLIKFQAISADSARIIFDGLDKNVQRGSAGVKTDNYIQSKESVNFQVGKTAPNFQSHDMHGNLINLSDFREKNYVLLDFWASWCVPCLKGLPHLKEIYKKYHDKGLEIVGISIDESKQDWLNSIEAHKISIWHQITSVENLEKANTGFVNRNDIKYKYPTNGIPKYILIDKNGVIMGYWDGYSLENEKAQDKVLKDIFKD